MYSLRVFFTPCLLLFLISLQVHGKESIELDDLIEFNGPYGERGNIVLGCEVLVIQATGVLSQASVVSPLDDRLKRAPRLDQSWKALSHGPISSYFCLYPEGSSNANACIEWIQESVLNPTLAGAFLREYFFLSENNQMSFGDGLHFRYGMRWLSG